MSILPAVTIVPKHEVTNNPATIGWKAWFCTSDDAVGPPIGRGTGPNTLRLSWTGADSFPSKKSVTLNWAEPIELHNGRAFWSGLGMDDWMSVCVSFDANTLTPNAGAGNVNTVAITGGNLILPAPLTDGSDDLTLATAIPVPAATPNAGYWHADYATGAITAVADIGSPDGKFDMIDFSTLAFWIREISLGDPGKIFRVENYKKQWFHQSWKLTVEVEKQVSAVAEFGAWLHSFRMVTT